MAKKKENKLTYLQMPLPESRKTYRTVKRSWSGLNYRQTIDSGALSMEKNISTAEAPYLTPSQRHYAMIDSYKVNQKDRDIHPIGLFGFDDFLFVIYREGKSIKADYIRCDDAGGIYDPCTWTLQETGATDEDEYPRCVVQFNKYLESDDIINGVYTKRLLIFPDKKSISLNVIEAETDPSKWDDTKIAAADKNAVYYYEDNGDPCHYRVTLDDTGEKYEVVKNGAASPFLCDSMDVTIKEYYNDVPKKDEDGKVIEPKEYPPPDSADTNCYYRNTYKCDETLNGTATFKYCQYDTVDEDGEKDGGTAYGWKISAAPSFPNIKYATVHASRLFGVGDDSVYVSGFNDYTNWNLDSIDASNESNAWCSKAQSNTKAGGDFTGIINFEGHVVCFKRDFMHEIYSTKNPFRIQDIYAEGAIDNRTIQDVDGRLIFVSEDNVKIYTGSNPRIISYDLNIGRYAKAVSGTDGRCYYLYCEDAEGNKRLLVYDTIVEQWSEQAIGKEVINFAHNKHGAYMFCTDGIIYRLNSELYDHAWSFETDLLTNQTVNIKHLKKMQILADIPEYAKGYANEDAGIKVYLLYDYEEFDDVPESRCVYDSSGHGRKAVRVKLRNTANYGLKLHVEGYGYVKLYELELFMENGGDLYV